MIIRFISCEIMLVSKLSLIIGSTRLDIVDPDRLAYAILLDSDIVNLDIPLSNCSILLGISVSVSSKGLLQIRARYNPFLGTRY